MRIGLIALEYSRVPGGMEEFARELAATLAGTDDLTVFAGRTAPIPESPCRVRPELGGEIRSDAARLRVERPDVWLALNAGYVQLAPRLDVPLIAYLHGSDFLQPWIRAHYGWMDRLERTDLLSPLATRLADLALRRGMRRGMAAAAGLIANSGSSRRLAEALYPGCGDRMAVIPPGVADRFFQAHAPRIPGATLKLLTVSRLKRVAARKNVDGVLRALTLLPSTVRVHYTVAGDGDDRPRLEAVAHEAGVGDRVTFAGAVDDDRLRGLYRESDLFIMVSRASRTDVEGFGIAYLEASAAGTPVVCSRAGGATDAVQNGVNGVVLDDATPGAIAGVVDALAAGRLRFDENRVRAVAEHHRWPLIAGRIRAVLARVVREAAHSPDEHHQRSS